MTFFEKLMKPFFVSGKIIPARLYNCGNYTLNQLIENNTGGEFDDIITELTTALDNLSIDLGDIDQRLNIQKNKTLSNDQVVDLFKTTMREKEGVIADKVGGFDTDAFREFYPEGVREYTRVTKTEMPEKTLRVKNVATTYSAALGATLRNLLQSFLQLWTDSRNLQQTQKGLVKRSRKEKKTDVLDVSKTMKKTIGVLWVKYDGDDEQATTYFDFNLLYNYIHHPHQKLSGAVPASSKKVLTNLGFNPGDYISVSNTTTNATFIIYLVAHADDEPTQSVELAPGKHIKELASHFGNLDGTFLVIKNISDVNEATYIVEFLQ